MSNAEVKLLREESSYDFGIRALGGRWDPPSVASTLTAGDGRFTLLAPSAGMWRVHVDHTDYVPLEYQLHPLLAPIQLPPAEMEQNSGLWVTVTRANGELIGDAGVRVTPTKRDLTDWYVPERLAWTSAEGLGELPKGKGESVGLTAFAHGFCEAAKSTTAEPHIEITLTECQNTQVQVVDEEQHALSGVLLRVGEARWVVGITDTNGRIGIPLPSVGSLRIELATENGHVDHDRLAASSNHLRVPIRLRRQLTLRGRVIDGTSRAPISGAIVWELDRPAAFSRSDTAGRYVLDAEAGAHQIAAAAEGYTGTVRQAAGEAGTLDPAVVFALTPTASLSGRIRDSQGGPVSGATVQARWWWPRLPMKERFAEGDPSGRFLISSLPATAVDVMVRAKGFVPVHQRFDLERRGPEPIVIALQRGRSIRGQVEDPRGAPLGGAEVRVRQRAHGRPISLTTDAEGHFEVPRLATGSYIVEIVYDGYAVSIQQVELRAAQDPLDLGVVRMQPQTLLTGVILTPEGEGIAGAELFVGRGRADLRIRDGSGKPASEAAAHSGADGRFEVPGLAAGEQVALEVAAEGFRLSQQWVTPSRGEYLEVVLEPAARLSGWVLTRDREPVGGAWVALTLPGKEVAFGMAGLQTVSSEDGTFVLDNLEPERYRLGVIAEGFALFESEVLAVEEDGIEALEVRLAPEAILVGRITGPEGAPVVGASVRVLPPKNRRWSVQSEWATTDSDGDGRFRLAGLREGMDTLEVTHPNYARLLERVPLEPGTQRIDLRLEAQRGQQILGRALDSSGQPVAGAELSLVPTLGAGLWVGTVYTARTGQGGAFQFPSVPEGSYRFAVSGTPLVAQPPTDRLNVDSSPIFDYELVLTAGTVLRGTLLGLDPDEWQHAQVTASGPHGTRTGRVDSIGRSYAIFGLLGGDWEVCARSDISGRTARTTINLGEETEAVLDLEFSHGLVLEGQVIRSSQPLSGAQVVLRALGTGERRSTWTDTQGLFSFSALDEGRYELRVLEQPSPPRFVPFLVHNEILDLQSNEQLMIEVSTGVLEGIVRNSSSGEPIEGAELRLQSVGESAFVLGQSTFTRSRGTYRLGPVPTGLWRVVVEAPGFAPLEKGVEIEGDDLQALDIELTPTEGLYLSVSLPSGQHPSNIEVLVLDQGGGWVTHTVVPLGAGGLVHLSSVPQGLWSLYLRSLDGTYAAFKAGIEAPGYLDLRLDRSGRLTILDTAEDGHDLDLVGTAVTLTRAAGQTVSWKPPRPLPTDAGILLTDVPPGPWIVTVRLEDSRLWQGAVTLLPGEQAALRIEP